MSTYADPQMSYQQQPKKKGWFGRNWLWFMPTVILLPILCCCGGGSWLVWFGVDQMLTLPPYQDTLSLAELDPDVQVAIGTPIDAPDSFMDLVDLENSGGFFEADTRSFYAEIPISGPNGTGWLYIDATSNDGGMTWQYTAQEIEIDATGDVIDLLNGSSNPLRDAFEDALDNE